MANATNAISFNTGSVGGGMSYHSTGNNKMSSYKHELGSSDIFSFSKKHPQISTNAVRGGSNASIW